ncbi:MAG: hypothetical protein MJ188_01875 [Treponema sp.]|nr:hypothetical protein [Treponema sp.]
MKRSIFFMAILLLATNNFFAQNKTNVINSNSIQAYRQALLSFDENDYGKALKYSEDAIFYRKQQIDYEASVLENSLSSKDAKKAGEKIENVISVLKERDELECIQIINFYVKKKGKDYFNDSVFEILNYIKNQSEYPEAQKLIGDIYKLEGEYDFAELYYKKALENEEVLDIPDEKYEILYLLADISRLKEDYDKMEVRLLNVIGNRQLNNNKALCRAMKNTVSANNPSDVNKFFQLFRTYDYYSLRAYGLLAEYYYNLQEYDKAFEYSSLAVINGFSKICSILEKRNLEYEFYDLEKYLNEVLYYPDIVKWGTDNQVWKNLNYFCEICQKLKYDKFALSLLRTLAKASPEQYWQQDAVIKLEKMSSSAL